MEGTIILHITFAIKQDQNLGKELIKYLKVIKGSVNSLIYSQNHGNTSCDHIIQFVFQASQSSPGKILTPFIVALALSVGQIHRFEETVSILTLC
jgi:Fanconi anemia group I protein